MSAISLGETLNSRAAFFAATLSRATWRRIAVSGFPTSIGIFALAIVASLAGNPVSAVADGQDQCADAQTPELHVFACTAVIEGGSGGSRNIEVAYLNRGLAYFAMRDLEKAVADLGAAIELSPQDSNAYEARAIVFSTQRDYDRAIEDDRRAVEINPRSTRAYNNMANNYKAKGDLGNAIAGYDRAIELSANEPKLYFNRANSLKAMGRLREAIKDYSYALQLDSTFLDAYINRGNAYETLGDLKNARTDFERVLDIDPMNNAAIVNKLGLDRLSNASQPYSSITTTAK